MRNYLILALLLLPVLATPYQFELNQWLDLNMTVTYTNDFMKCYLTNSTYTFWDSNSNGTSTILASNHTLNYTYDLRCCDNCHFLGNTLYLSDFSLNYLLGSHNITGNMVVNYYVADVVEDLRLISGVTNVAETRETGGIPMDFWISLVFPLSLAMGFYYLTEDTGGLVVGGGIGAIMSVAWLWFSGSVSKLTLIVFVFLFIGVVGSWAKLNNIKAGR